MSQFRKHQCYFFCLFLFPFAISNQRFFSLCAFAVLNYIVFYTNDFVPFNNIQPLRSFCQNRFNEIQFNELQHVLLLSNISKYLVIQVFIYAIFLILLIILLLSRTNFNKTWTNNYGWMNTGEQIVSTLACFREE